MPQILEGQWEDILAHSAAQLTGRRVKISIEPEIEPEEETDALAEAIARLNNRTHEEIMADRARVLAASPPPRPLPEGKTLEDVISGKWPGNETDDEIAAALRELS